METTLARLVAVCQVVIQLEPEARRNSLSIDLPHESPGAARAPRKTRTKKAESKELISRSLPAHRFRYRVFRSALPELPVPAPRDRRSFGQSGPGGAKHRIFASLITLLHQKFLHQRWYLANTSPPPWGDRSHLHRPDRGQRAFNFFDAFRRQGLLRCQRSAHGIPLKDQSALDAGGKVVLGERLVQVPQFVL